MIETQKLPEQLPPTVQHEIATKHGVILPLDAQPIASFTDTVGDEHKAIAKLYLPDYAYEGDGGNRTEIFVVRHVIPTKSKRRSDNTLLKFFVRGDDHEIREVDPYSLARQGSASRLGLRRNPGPGYSFKEAIIAPPSPKTAPSSFALTFEVTRLINPDGPMITVDDIGRAIDKSNPSVPIVEVAEGVQPIIMSEGKLDKYVSGADAELERGRKQSLKLKVAKWMAGLCLMGAAVDATFSTGGVIDKVQDLRSDAGDFVHQTLHSDNPETQAAIDRLAQTMHALDAHDTAAIDRLAGQFKEQYRDQLMPEATAQNFYTQIEQAKTHDDIQKVMDQFMQFYGKRADFLLPDSSGDYSTPSIDAFSQDRTPLATLKQYSLGIIDAYSYLPKRLIKEDANFDRLLFGTPIINKDDGRARESGEYHYNTHGLEDIRIAVDPSIKDPRSWAAVAVLHETAHAQDMLDPHDTSGRELNDDELRHYTWQEMWDNPEYISDYAGANSAGTDLTDVSSEDFAETRAYTLAPGKLNRLFHPDDARYFKSLANQKSLMHLSVLEKQYPGISALIAQRVGATKYHRYNTWYTNGLN